MLTSERSAALLTLLTHVRDVRVLYCSRRLCSHAQPQARLTSFSACLGIMQSLPSSSEPTKSEHAACYHDVMVLLVLADFHVCAAAFLA
jgi:hypothetical protein